MSSRETPDGQSVPQLGHHIGRHVEVNLGGKNVGGTQFEGDDLAAGVIVGVGPQGNSLTIQLDAPVGSGEPRGRLHRRSKGQDLVSVDDLSRPRVVQDDPAAFPTRSCAWWCRKAGPGDQAVPGAQRGDPGRGRSRPRQDLTSPKYS